MAASPMVNPGNQRVWVNTDNCKACDICVEMCPSGVLGMKYESTSTLGAMISVDYEEDCIGCNECELSCPDFAIFVANKADLKEAGINFAKLTDTAKSRQEKIIANNYMSLSEKGNK